LIKKLGTITLYVLKIKFFLLLSQAHFYIHFCTFVRFTLCEIFLTTLGTSCSYTVGGSTAYMLRGGVGVFSI